MTPQEILEAITKKVTKEFVQHPTIKDTLIHRTRNELDLEKLATFLADHLPE